MLIVHNLSLTYSCRFVIQHAVEHLIKQCVLRALRKFRNSVARGVARPNEMQQ